MGFVSVANIMKKVEKKDEFLLNEMRRVQCSKYCLIDRFKSEKGVKRKT